MLGGRRLLFLAVDLPSLFFLCFLLLLVSRRRHARRSESFKELAEWFVLELRWNCGEALVRLVRGESDFEHNDGTVKAWRLEVLPFLLCLVWVSVAADP